LKTLYTFVVVSIGYIAFLLCFQRDNFALVYRHMPWTTIIQIPHKLIGFKEYLQNNLEGRFRYLGDYGSFLVNSLYSSFRVLSISPIWNSISPNHTIFRWMTLMHTIVICCEMGARRFDKVEEISKRLLFLVNCIVNSYFVKHAFFCARSESRLYLPIVNLDKGFNKYLFFLCKFLSHFTLGVRRCGDSFVIARRVS